MPRLSDTMTDGTVATWLKKVGDKIAEGDILAEIETDKATMEFESFNAGTLLFIGIQEGQTAPVDSVLAIIGPDGTDITGIAENYKKGGNVTAPVAEKAIEVSNSTPNTTQNEEENAKGKLQKKNLDMIVLNSLRDEGAGFKGATNKIKIITESTLTEFPLKSKNDVAKDILNFVEAQILK